MVVVHGSRREQETRHELRQTVDAVRRAIPGVEVISAALQFNSPTLEEAVTEAVAGGAERVIVVPMFLFAGNHVTQDIPSEVEVLRERFPGVEFVCANHIGPDRRVAEILVDRIRHATGGDTAGRTAGTA